MAIKVGGTTVIDDSKNITNITNVAAATAQITGEGGAYISSGGLTVGTTAVGPLGEFRATGDIITNYSDRRLKTDIHPIEQALNKVNQIQGVYYRPNSLAESLGYNDNKLRVGVIAQEVEAVLPEVVVRAPIDIAKDNKGNEYSRTGENYITVQYDRLVPLLIQAINELTERVHQLEKANKQ